MKAMLRPAQLLLGVGADVGVIRRLTTGALRARPLMARWRIGDGIGTPGALTVTSTRASVPG
jgi:hypothetical protein